jgi:hypothetical protein
MTRPNRTSRILDKAETRAAGLQSISPTLDLGQALTLTNYRDQIQRLRDRLETYNAALASIGKYQNEVEALEKTLADLSEHMLLGVASHYGKNSNEYQMAGGVRKSDRKRPVRVRVA